MKNEKANETKAESGKQRSEVECQRADVRRLEWWEALAPGERRFLCNVMRMIRAAKQSHLPEVAHAAAKWEITLACFIRVRLVVENRKAVSRKLKVRAGRANELNRHSAICITVGTVRRDGCASATASPSTLRSLPGASPNQD
jgi:hypothetical protein